MKERAAKLWFIGVIVVVVAAMLIFKVRIAVLNAKYLIILLGIIGLVALVTKKR